jgi:cytochrome b involved in lipid metabolism
MADVQKHNSATTCWSAVNGTVYDLTSWVNAHPGGKAAILMICGKDGSALFNAQHGGSGKVANILAKFKIGALS